MMKIRNIASITQVKHKTTITRIDTLANCPTITNLRTKKMKLLYSKVDLSAVTSQRLTELDSTNTILSSMKIQTLITTLNGSTSKFRTRSRAKIIGSTLRMSTIKRVNTSRV